MKTGSLCEESNGDKFHLFLFLGCTAMYLDESTGKLFEGEEQFSLKALAVSKGKTAFKSETTPQLFESGDEVKLNKIYRGIYDELKTKLKYKKYFSTWIVVGSGWSVTAERWYYMIRLRLQTFVWVTEDQITKVSSTQTQMVDGPREERFRRRQMNRLSDYNPWSQKRLG